MGIAKKAAEAADDKRFEDQANGIVTPVEPKETGHHIKIDINPADIMLLGEKAGEFVLKPEAEESILGLLKLQKLVNDALGMVNQSIVEAGLKITPHFSSISGDSIKFTYQPSGATYKVENANIKRHNPMFFKKKISYSLDSDAVKAYEYKHKGKLPANIVRAKRNKNLVPRPAKELGL